MGAHIVCNVGIGNFAKYHSAQNALLNKPQVVIVLLSRL